MKAVRAKLFILIITLNLSFVFLPLLYSCNGRNNNKQNVIFDFENENELDLFTWKCPSAFSISKEWAESGNSSLKFEFYPSKKIGFSSGNVKRSWKNSNFLIFSVYNPYLKPTDIYIRISDNVTKGNPTRAYVSKLIVGPGENKIKLPLKSFLDSNGRLLNLNNMRGIYIFKKDVCSHLILFFDYFFLI
jgi:hypothetical protein